MAARASRSAHPAHASLRPAVGLGLGPVWLDVQAMGQVLPQTTLYAHIWMDRERVSDSEQGASQQLLTQLSHTCIT